MFCVWLNNLFLVMQGPLKSPRHYYRTKVSHYVCAEVVVKEIVILVVEEEETTMESRGGNREGWSW